MEEFVARPFPHFPSLLPAVGGTIVDCTREMLLKEKMKVIDEHIECQRMFEKWWDKGEDLASMKEYIDEYKRYKKEWFKEWFKENNYEDK